MTISPYHAQANGWRSGAGTGSDDAAASVMALPLSYPPDSLNHTELYVSVQSLWTRVLGHAANQS
jgi:hypothetical protein